MSDIKLLYNSSCSKCRNALSTLKENDIDPDVIEYLNDPLTEEQLRGLLEILEDEPADLVRKDTNFQKLGLDQNDYADADSIVTLLVQHPILMQRPIAIHANKAFIARTPEKVNELL